MNTRKLCACGLMAAVLCAVAPVSLPIGPIPVSLATLCVYLAGLLLGAKGGALCVAAYVLLGTAGLPVFSGFSGGAAKLVGPTGGYILGYLPCALIAGISADRMGGRLWSDILALLLGTLALYALGTAWFCFSTGTGVWEALGLCVFPFLAIDLGKIVAASLLAKPLRAGIRAVQAR